MKRIEIWILIVLVVLCFGNTITLNYTLDDRLVIFQNDYTLKGWDGMKDIITKEGFSGFFGNDRSLVAGGRYRPFSQLTFVVEYELFGQKIHNQVGFHQAPQNEQVFIDAHLPIVSHIINILLYLALVILVYTVLNLLFAKYNNSKWWLSLPFIATLLFALHPLHTEVVANIKGRDEILSMLGGMGMIWMSIKYIQKRNILYLFVSFLSFLIGVFSKENALTFLAILPLSIYFIDFPKKKSDWFIPVLPCLIVSVFFIWMRYEAIGSMMATDSSNTILNNPFLYSTKTQEIATVIFTWAIYLKLLFIPYPLTHDYYPNQIEIVNFSNPWVISMLFFLSFLLFYAIKNIRIKNVIAFGILFFIITFSMVSNLFFNIGTFMNERFMFAPLLGFTVITAYFIHRFSLKKESIKLISGIFISISFIYLTISVIRNFTWKDDFTLFTHDVEISANSIKCNISAGGSYISKYEKTKNTKYLHTAEKHLLKAVQMDKSAANGHELLGKLYFLRQNYPLSLQFFKNLETLKPQDKQTKANIQAVLASMQTFGVDEASELLKQGNSQEAMRKVDDLIRANGASAQTYNLKGKIFGMGMNRIDSSLFYLNKAMVMDSTFYPAFENAGVAYAILKDFKKAEYYLLKAYTLSPNTPSIAHNLSNVYSEMGNREKSEKWKNMEN